MSIRTMPESGVVPPLELPMARFTVDEYHLMIEAGVFADGRRAELLEGWIVSKMSRKPPHDVTILVTQRILNAILPMGWHIRAQMAITTADSNPEPDLAIVRGADRDYLSRHPGPADLALVVEVADSTIATDRALKGSIYARAGIPVYWIINLVERRVEVYTAPSGPEAGPSYRERRNFQAGETIPLTVEGREIARIEAGQLLP